jgi:hypothetical protein
VRTETDDPPDDLIPTFRQPTRTANVSRAGTGLTEPVGALPQPEPLTTGPDPLDPLQPSLALGLAEPIDPVRPGHTRTSTGGEPGTGKPSQADATKLVAGLLLGIALIVGTLVRLRTQGGRLRQPSRTQADDVAKPLASIGLRHVAPEVFNADLGDAISAAAALGAYLADGPLVLAPNVSTGLPAPTDEEDQ